MSTQSISQCANWRVVGILADRIAMKEINETLFTLSSFALPVQRRGLGDLPVTCGIAATMPCGSDLQPADGACGHPAKQSPGSG